MPGVDDLPEGGLARLIAIMARLRDPVSGCPWDIAQDFASIAPYTIEEAYEVADVIERKAWNELADELGDLLLQVVYHARMAEEAGWFAFDAVADAISDKMIRRHPHVFGEDTAPRTADQQVHAWETQKATERAERAMSVLDNVPVGLPALTRAVKLQRRAARVGFDWPDKRQVLDKIVEEAAELAAEIGGDADRVEDEYADLLFAVVNLGRHLDVDPEKALRRVNAKFTRRFQAIEAALTALGRKPEDATLDEMEALWQQAKRAT
jgi:ATP diphosphatase